MQNEYLIYFFHLSEGSVTRDWLHGQNQNDFIHPQGAVRMVWAFWSSRTKCVGGFPKKAQINPKCV